MYESLGSEFALNYKINGCQELLSSTIVIYGQGEPFKKLQTVGHK